MTTDRVTPRPIAMVGLGHLGAPIARNLLKSGFDLRVYNRTTAKAEPLVAAGAVASDSPAAAVNGADVVVSCLHGDDSVLDMLERDDGLLASMGPTTVHLSTTTISPSCAAEVARRHRDAGQRFVASPVIGRPPSAEAGELTALVAGPAEDVSGVRDVLEAFSSRIIDAGTEASAAAAMKLTVNYYIFSTVELFGQIFALTEKAGIRVEAVTELLDFMRGHPAFREYLSRVGEQRFTDPGFEAATALKDVTLIQQLARELGVPLAYADIVEDRLTAVIASDRAQLDWSVITSRAPATAQHVDPKG